MKYCTLLVSLAAVSGCASTIPQIASQSAVNAVARSVQIECASLLAGATGETFRQAVDAELARRDVAARTTPPDCGKRP